MTGNRELTTECEWSSCKALEVYEINGTRTSARRSVRCHLFCQCSPAALAVDKEVLSHDALTPTNCPRLLFFNQSDLQLDKVKRQMTVSNGKLSQLKQDFFMHHFVHSWMFLRSPQKQLENLVKEWNYDALCSTEPKNYVETKCKM
ncbi:hypothetical protein HYC85_026359 [Camellia sinensis]|uniref:Uncharacterized protein n=1 Tax=Camellia sinensis TaxID=4442 RepID=A0A7J7G3C8_CAMSI|nr:hypothetical protein HYC85_026359 [Camellia sinensis]